MSRLFAGTPLEQPASCDRCNRPHAQCVCPRDRLSGKVLEPGSQPVRIRRDKRGGKMVTVITGFAPRSAKTDDLPALLKTLRARLGAGGSLTNAETSPTIELQGDHRERVMEHLNDSGYRPRLAGG
ncbi:MAG: translation initiation factor [Phycisphaerales bacterium]